MRRKCFRYTTEVKQFIFFRNKNSPIQMYIRISLLCCHIKCARWNIKFVFGPVGTVGLSNVETEGLEVTDWGGAVGSPPSLSRGKYNGS